MTNEPQENQEDGGDEAFALLVPVVLVAILNGMHSPFTLVVQKLSPAWYPPYFPAYPEIVFYLSSLLVSSLTLMVAGIPAGLYERFSNARHSTFISMGIWLLCAALLTLPSLEAVVKLLRM